MALRINDSEFYAIDAHSHLGRRKTPLGHGVASFLGDDLVRNLDEAGLDCAVAFPLGASYTDYSEANQIMAEEMAKYPETDHQLLPHQSQLRPRSHGESSRSLSRHAETKRHQTSSGDRVLRSQ